MSRAMSRAPSWMERGILRAGGCLRTALRFQGTRLAIQLAGAIAHHAVLIDKRARHSIDFLALPEFLPGRADIPVALRTRRFRRDLAKGRYQAHVRHPGHSRSLRPTHLHDLLG